VAVPVVDTKEKTSTAFMIGGSVDVAMAFNKIVYW
jgi:hypothetical protein